MMVQDGKKTEISGSKPVDPEDIGTFRTTDIALAAALKANDHKLKDMFIKTERAKQKSFKRTEFVFDDKGVKATIMAYHNNDLLVDARALMNIYEDFKNFRFNRGATT